MRLIIIGASGLIGSSLFNAAKRAGKQVIGTCYSHGRNDFLRYDMRRERLGSIIPDIGPEDTVYLLSAYTNVSWIYNNQEKASELNLHGTKKLIDEIASLGARIIFLSSVEVFGSQEGRHNEETKPSPSSVYGRMKFDIEEYLHQKKCKSTIVRSGWNVGWDINSPCVVKLTYQALLKPGARMARDNILSIIDLKDTVDGLLKLLDREELSICHLASAPPILRTELASMVIRFSKYKEQMSFETVWFSDIIYPEQRNRNNQLDNSLAVSVLGMNFSKPEDIIRQKVELLDQGI